MNDISEKRKALYLLAGRNPSQYDNHIILDICTACGADCVYCLHQAAGLAKPKLMPRESFFKIIDILEAEGYELVYLYQSGESFHHPNYFEFVTAVAERNMDSSTATKLFMPIDWDAFDQALARCEKTGRYVEYLVTVDALNQNAQDKIGPGIKTEAVKANLAKLAELNSKYDCMRCILDSIVHANNEHNIDEFPAYFSRLGFDTWYPRRMGYFMPSFARKEDLQAIAAVVPSSTEHPARFSIIDDELIPYEPQKRCDLGAAAVSPDGDLTVCCHDMLHINKLGNILETGSLREIMASDRFQEAANKGRNMQLPICQGCN